ncbi:MAG: phosphorylase [Janthinobacterium lividum]
MQQPVLVVTGLEFEARIAARERLHVPRAARRNAQGRTPWSISTADGQLRLLCGPGSSQLNTLVQAAAREGCAGILSFGTVGALAPVLNAGDWVLAREVVCGGQRHTADPRWLAALARALPEAIRVDYTSAPFPITTVAAKHELYRSTGASVVDMETSIVASVAADCGLPFAACRVVIDAASRRLPAAAVVSMRNDGSTDLRAIMAALWRRPADLPPLLRLGRDAALAQRALRHGRARLGARFGFPELAAHLG